MCVLDEHGCPISWGLTDQFATMIHGYTLPKHRRKGYNRLIATNLAKVLHSKRFPAQGNVLEDNLPSLTLLKSMNARFLPCQFVRLIHIPFCLLAKPEWTWWIFLKKSMMVGKCSYLIWGIKPCIWCYTRLNMLWYI